MVILHSYNILLSQFSFLVSTFFIGSNGTSSTNLKSLNLLNKPNKKKKMKKKSKETKSFLKATDKQPSYYCCLDVDVGVNSITVYLR